jgi:prolyl oligopeptidase
MHALGWPRQQAIDFMAENTALTLLNIANEVDRYIAMPGQALAYKTGELKIRELRSLAEHELGSKFDVRVFHEVLLRDGALPLSVLETIIKRWLTEQS